MLFNFNSEFVGAFCLKCEGNLMNTILVPFAVRVVCKAFAGPVGRGPGQHEGGAWRHGGGDGPVALGSRVVRDAAGAETIGGGGGGLAGLERTGGRILRGREGGPFGEGGGRGIALDDTVQR
ncbi:unnamed protein product [Allacma fusca]|uniref:Uncharacterized protein n=1 Tax=Allacma fusca TaxID=39272 RepID=A0A8J2J1P5_9HEXA|nr:unnamed protein product [Allacma fusca]